MLHLRSFNRFLLLSLALLGLSVSSANAVSLNVSGGQLLGAYDVNVGGNLYDVEFVDGSCQTLFSGCGGSGTHEFAFSTAEQAEASSQSLLDSVFGGEFAGGPFDTNPELTVGITNTSLGVILTGFGAYDLDDGSLYLDGAFNSSLAEPDRLGCATGQCSLLPDVDLATLPNAVYAQWTGVSAVPVPAAVWLFGTALVGLIGFGKRKPRIAA
jgi:hypothetical protein